MPAPQPFTLTFGPWQPDLANVAYQTLQLQIPVTVPCADCLNVRYVNGVYQALPTIQNVSGTPALGARCLGAMTLIDATGSPIPVAGDSATLSAYTWGSGAWTGSASGFTSLGGTIEDWNFVQFGDQVFAQPVPSSFGGLNTGGTGNLFAFSPQGTGVPVAASPFGTVLGVVGQFVMVGDIADFTDAATPFEIGVGNGSLKTFSGVLPYAPVYPGAQFVTLSNPSAGYTGAMTAGTTTEETGFVASSFGSISPTTDGDSNTITALYGTWFTNIHGQQVASGIVLKISSASALGIGYISTLTITGNSLNEALAGSSATYAFAGGVNTWTWNTFAGGDFLFTSGDSYAVNYPITATANEGYDNGSGVITPVAGATLSSGTINYDTGAVSLTFGTAPVSGIGVYVSYGLAARARLQWSAIGNATNWPVPLTQAAYAAEAGEQDLEYAYGPIMAIVGFPLYGLIFQRNAITRANYIGGNVVFSWGTYSYNLGLIAKGAYIQVGPNVYFLCDQGFFYTDGANVYPIGEATSDSAGIDAWFWANVNQSALSVINAAYDARSRNVYFAIPTGSNTLPDTLLCYNVLAGQWTRGACSSEFIWTDSDGFTDRLGLFDQTHEYSLLTGTPNTGYLESCDIQFADGLSRTTLQVKPIADGTTLTGQIGTRQSLSAAVSYTAAVTPDAYGSGFAPVLAQGMYTRARVSSADAVSIQGAVLMMAPGGPV